MDGTITLPVVLVLVAVLLAIAAPVVLGVSSGRRIPFAVALLLTIAAVLMAVNGKNLADTIMAVGIWVGAMIAGFAGYLNGVVTTAARNHAYRLIHMHQDGLRKPNDDR